jgi:hercynylcysteine S-oxide lyase
VLLLGSWPGTRTVAWLPIEYSPNLAIMAANGFDVRALPVDSDVPAGRRRGGHRAVRRAAGAGAPHRAGAAAAASGLGPAVDRVAAAGDGEANVAARVGYSVALGKHLAAGPDRIRARLAEWAT